ncbi:hypothetical protein C8R44DRAFT_546673, partial [Mycena epipterygia]
QVGHFTMDNASVNSTFMTHLQLALETHGHPDFDDAVLLAPRTTRHKWKTGPIYRAQRMVGFIRKSGQRHDQLLNTIKEGNDQQLWTETVECDRRTEQIVVLLKPLMVLPDVKTRWDSVFYMLHRLRYLCQVSQFFAPRPCDLLHIQTPSARAGFFSLHQQQPHNVQSRLATDNTPMLASIIPVFELFVQAWKSM